MEVVFDSGSTYSIVLEETYARLVSAAGVTLQGSSLTEVVDPNPELPRCWQDSERTESPKLCFEKFTWHLSTHSSGIFRRINLQIVVAFFKR